MKYCFAWITVFVMLLCAAPSTFAAEHISGDVNGDDLVGAADAAAVLRAADGTVEMDAASLLTADVTGNQTVGQGDAQAILLLSTGKLKKFTDLTGITKDSITGERFLDKFSYQGIRIKGACYQSDSVSITVTRSRNAYSVYYVADIYVRRIASLRNAFSSGAYLGQRERTERIAQQNDALLAISGDGYSDRTRGPVVRNGVWYRNTMDKDADIAVLTRQGELKTYSAGSVTIEQLEADDPWQIWTYGPLLLTGEGKIPSNFHCDRKLQGRMARAAIGYYEPGHYSLICVEGTQQADSEGMTLDELAHLVDTLGCKTAYNLVGGRNATLSSSTDLISTPQSGTRTISDIFFLTEPTAEGMQ